MSIKQKLPVIIVLIIILGALVFLVAGNPFSGQGNQSSESSSGSSNGGSGQFDDFLGNTNKGETRDAKGNTSVEISVDDFIFDPTIITVSQGTTITWTNNGQAQHNVVSDDSSPEKGLGSELLKNGESYEYTFDKPGTYYYLCEPHPTQMRGVVIVE